MSFYSVRISKFVPISVSPYIIGSVNTNRCTNASIAIYSVEECKEAADKLAMEYRGWISASSNPKGCYITSSDRVYYNTHHTGQRSGTRKPLCKRKKVVFLSNIQLSSLFNVLS